MHKKHFQKNITKVSIPAELQENDNLSPPILAFLSIAPACSGGGLAAAFQRKQQHPGFLCSHPSKQQVRGSGSESSDNLPGQQLLNFLSVC